MRSTKSCRRVLGVFAVLPVVLLGGKWLSGVFDSYLALPSTRNKRVVTEFLTGFNYQTKFQLSGE